LEGVKVPLPPLQTALDALVTAPFKVAVGLTLQTSWSGPAFAVIGIVKELTTAVAVIGGQPVLSKTVKVYVPGPTVTTVDVLPVLHEYV
jgi:hypothetical protein